MKPTEQRLISITTLSATSLKLLADVLKEVLVYAALQFVPDSDEGKGRIRMVAVNPSQVAMVHLTLNAEGFETFYVKRPVTIGVNVMKLQKILRSVSTDDLVELYVLESDPNKLFVSIRKSEECTSVYRLNLLDVETVDRNIEDMTFNTSFQMPSADLQRTIRDMIVLGAEHLEIKVIGNTSVVLSCEGDICSRETTYQSTGSSYTLKISSPDERKITQAVYDIQFLSSFSRCSALDSTMTAFMGEDMPLVLRYAVGQLGEVRFLLSDVVQ